MTLIVLSLGNIAWEYRLAKTDKMKAFRNIEFSLAGIQSAVSVHEFSKAIKHELPPDYVRFLESVNGGVTDGWFEFWRKDEYVAIQCFYSLTNLEFDGLGLYSNYEDFIEEYGESDLLPFAMDVSGSPICISIIEPHGVIVSPWRVDDGLSVAHIADSFSDFMDNLIENTD